MFGLFVVGLAIAPLFPVAISLGLRHSPAHPVPVLARMGSSARSPSSPPHYSLGELADWLNLFAALRAVLALLLLAAAALHLDGRRARLGQGQAPPGSANTP